MVNVTNVVNEKKFSNSKICLENRNKLTISGVEKALSSNESNLILLVGGSKLYISGHNIHIEKLDVESGVVEAEGDFTSFKFSSGVTKGSFVKRIFK